MATYFAVLGKSRPSRSILSKLVPFVEQQSIALTPHPVLLSEAFLERVGHKVEALQQQPTDTKTELTETTAELSEIHVRILLGQAADTFANLVENLTTDGAPVEQFKP